MALRSVSLSYTDSTGTARTITDDGAGALTGDVDPAGTNTIDYDTGAIDVDTLYVMQGGTLAVVDYYAEAAETLHVEDFADSTNGYTAGSDGTFTSLTYGRNQVSSPTLVPTLSGMYALDRVDALMQVILPDFVGDLTIQGDLLDYVDGRPTVAPGADRFAILNVPSGYTAQQDVDWFRYTVLRFSRYAALYAPWVKLADPNLSNRVVLFPAVGHIAGIYARVDSTRNVSKAPAGTPDGSLAFLSALEVAFSKGERDVLQPAKINPLREDAAVGRCVWGTRTISNESDWIYVPVRRMFMFIERSIYNATQWSVFEPNGPQLWLRLKTQISGFLGQLFTEQYFAGATPAQAFQVKVNADNNPPVVVDAGQTIVDIAVAPLKPAEFIRLRFTQLQL